MTTPNQRRFIESMLAVRTAALAAQGWGADAVLAKADALDSKGASALIDLIKGMPEDPSAGPGPERLAAMDTLRAMVPTLGQRDRDFALSLIQQFDGRGRLSDKQWPHVERLAAGPAPTVEVDEGVWVLADGTLINVYRTRNGYLAGKVWTGSSWSYESGAQRRAGGGRKITAEEAAAFGHATDHCVFCARELTHDNSTEVGYGPVCAQKNGLPWGVAVPA
jgi:hypothetical protein